MTYTIHNTNSQNLNRSQRASRMLVAVSLLGVTISAPAGALGGLAVLPLVAIYPLITAVLGWDPIFEMFGWGAGDIADGKLGHASHVELALTGIVLIGGVLVAPEAAAAGFSVLALAGIFPLVSALIGADLLQPMVAGTRREFPEVRYETRPGIADSTAVVSAAINDIRAPGHGRRAA